MICRNLPCTIPPVQANRNRLLDVARETFKENVGDIIQLTEALKLEHSIPLQSIYQDSGFVFCIKKSDLEGDLPPGFINVVSKGAKYHFSSVELVCVISELTSAIRYLLIICRRREMPV